MKKVLVSVTAILAMAACSKSNNTTPPSSTATLIQGHWTGNYYVRTGYISGVAISTKDSALNPMVQSLDVTLASTSAADSITGTVGTGASISPVLGVYVLNTNVTPNTIHADFGTTANLVLDAGVNVNQSDLVFTQNKKETVEIGGQTADSTVTVVAFKKAAN